MTKAIAIACFICLLTGLSWAQPNDRGVKIIGADGFELSGQFIYRPAKGPRVAGAGLTDLISMYGMVGWSFGGKPENYHFEASQERVMVPPWQDLEGFVRNSPGS